MLDNRYYLISQLLLIQKYVENLINF
uniref:Uncharacterized protein n=1 Tax=Arundo donax TaxID=35708 RepID=A0A0A8Z7Z1_ARUDO